VTTRGEPEYLDVDQVRTFDGPTGLLRHGREPDFRMMSLRLRGEKRPVVLENLRAALSRLAPPQQKPVAAVDALKQPPRQMPIVEVTPVVEALPVVEKAIDPDPTWLRSWEGVYLASSETQALGHEFFTRTTVGQEAAVTAPRGVTFVEGVAGAGKTSVALGRLKFFANFRTGEHLDEYGLKNAPLSDFLPSGMAGFVLSHSLKRYLRDTAAPWISSACGSWISMSFGRAWRPSTA
jgi:hypothetical protein